ncbi:hypothetical protein GUJ93_ZPchr0009g841 [Zizania palustris]|uniref:Uncharacterized protein n=1 Tax=Zizania palustris TaxID=103762 RepID=A0A8J5UYW4_ZIZPA|nr:hypothetical protein GUJ93_ZPchr0009g841 [Zizania palustris]
MNPNTNPMTDRKLCPYSLLVDAVYSQVYLCTHQPWEYSESAEDKGECMRNGRSGRARSGMGAVVVTGTALRTEGAGARHRRWLLAIVGGRGGAAAGQWHMKRRGVVGGRGGRERRPDGGVGRAADGW